MTAGVEDTTRGGVTRPVIVAAVAGTFALTFTAFLLSYAALRDLADLAGVPAGQAWLWPVIVDGVILEATISVVALRVGALPARRFAWLLLVAGAAVSVAANITHAIVTADARVPALVAALVASVPPLVLVAMTHLTVELIRNVTPRNAPTRLAIAAPSSTAADGVAGELPGVMRARVRQIPLVDTAASPGAPRRGQRQQRREEARRLAEQDVPLREIASRFGVHPTTVSRWLNAPDRSSEGSSDEHDD